MLSSADIGLGVLHIATGAFFTVTGFRKAFKPDVRNKVCAMLERNGTPHALALACIAGELLGGLGLLFGVLTHLAALGLVPIMLGAYEFGAWPGVKAKQNWTDKGTATLFRVGPLHWRPESWSQLISNALCTPEAQLLIIVVALAFTGGGSITLDSLIWR